MTQEKAKAGMMGSKYTRMLLLVLAGLFTFGAPYVAFVVNSLLDQSIYFSFASGFVLFIVGLALIWYLIRKKVIS